MHEEQNQNHRRPAQAACGRPLRSWTKKRCARIILVLSIMVVLLLSLVGVRSTILLGSGESQLLGWKCCRTTTASPTDVSNNDNKKQGLSFLFSFVPNYSRMESRPMMLTSSLSKQEQQDKVALVAPADANNTTNDTSMGSAQEAAARLSSQHDENNDTMLPAKGKGYNPYWLVLSQTLQLAVTIVPKVMCSSIRTALNALECSRDKHKNARCAEARKNAALQTRDLANMTRVAFVRDPLERALSAYQNSDRNRYIDIHHCRNTTICTFAEWVEELHKEHRTSKTFRNEHFVPQVNILQFSQMRYDYVFRLSSVMDQNYFWNTLCHRKDSIKANVARSVKNGDSISKGDKKGGETSTIKGLEHFTPKIFETLANIYAEDLVLWEKVLKYGTPRDPNEQDTLYDYYMRHLSTSEGVKLP